jgi:[ribosomal protein S5]-alanine N-acetyltransferase
LRPICMDDAPAIQNLFPFWGVVEYLAAVIPWPYPEDGAEQFLKMLLPEMEAGNRLVWAITRKEDEESRLMGLIELSPNNPNDSRGFWLGLPYQRQGYMTEAVTAVNDFAFDILGMTEMTLSNAEPNVGSHRLKEKSGAEFLSYEDDVAFIGGKFRTARWRLTAEMWRANRERFVYAD